MNADLLNLDSASCPRPSGRKVLRTEYVTTSAYIYTRDEFISGGGGGLKSLARIFCPLLARKSNAFARIVPNCLNENCYLKNSYAYA